MEKLVIIDGNSLINRAFYALPLLSNKNGEFSNAVFGFTTMLIKTIQEHTPTHIVVAFDYGKHTFRHDIYKEYKGTRHATPEELKSQFPILKRLLNAMHIKMFEIEGIEADDIIGTLSKKFSIPTIIVTGDRDALQLIDNTTEVWLTKKGISEVSLMTEDSLYEELLLKPYQIVELKALMGDSSDNIPGVKGVGEKTALQLLHQYGNVKNIFDNIDSIKGKLQEKLLEGKEMAELSHTLATINCNVDLQANLDDFKYEFPFGQEVYKIFREYNFNSLLKRPELFKQNYVDEDDLSSIDKKIVTIDKEQSLNDLANKIIFNKQFAFEINNGFNISLDNETEYIINYEGDLLSQSLDIDNIFNILKPVFEDENIKKIVYDKKELMHILDKYNICLKGVCFDCLLAYYLINAGDKNLNKQSLQQSLGLDLKYVASNLFDLKPFLEKKLQEFSLQKLYYEIEFPLIDVLFDMEKTGFKIDPNVLDELSIKYNQELEELTRQIYIIAGEEFNINSPKQVSKVLFEDLGLKAYNNKKQSTGIDILEELFDKHEIVPLLIRYRKIKKLSTTYVEAYKQLLNKDNIIHTVFNQTLTATGRLSSSEPNLQNIPTRDEEGKVLRKMFIPSRKDGVLVSADYSQIELRLLAHFSNDPNLINAYIYGEDIHTQTASEVFGVSPSNVTPKMRRDAKAVNFGIIYGISEYGLAQNIGCSRKQAKYYMDIYFSRYPMVKAYMDSNIEIAKKQGYVTTLMGRRRKINELNSPNYAVRQFGERASMNMPLQGTASDIIKIAMNKVYNALKQQNLKSKLILQIHDELIVDCTHDEITQVVNILRENMEGAVKLSVPLKVDINMGKNWFDCK